MLGCKLQVSVRSIIPRHAALLTALRMRLSIIVQCCVMYPMESRRGLPERKLRTGRNGKVQMLETIALILIVLWVLGLVSSATMGGFIHILLVIAIVLIVLRVIRG